MKNQINKPNIELFTLSIAHGLNHIYKIFFTPLLPLIIAQFNVNYTKIGILVSMAYITYGLISFPAGILVDKIGRKKIMMFSILLPALICFVGGFAKNYISLLFSFVLLGISGGLYHPSSMAYITEISTINFRGKAFGIHGIGGNIGMMIAPVITSFIASYLGWQGSFWLWSIPGILLYFFMKNILPEDGINNNKQDKYISFKFINLTHVLALIIVVITGFLFEGVFVYLPVLLMDIKELTIIFAGGLAGINYFAGILGQYFGGVMTDIFGEKIPLLIGSLGSFLTILFLTFVNENFILIINVFAIGFFLFFLQPSLMSYFSKIVPTKYQGTSYGIYFGFQYVSGAFAPVLGGFIADKYSLIIFFILLSFIALAGGLIIMSLNSGGDRKRSCHMFGRK